MRGNGIISYKPKYNIVPADVHSTISKYMLADGMKLVFDLHNSKGTRIIGENTGKEFLDFFTCFASMPIGVNHPALSEPDFIEYIGNISLNKTSNSDVYTTVLATFAETLYRTAVPGHFKYAFFIEGGALAVENALKTAFDWKVRKNFRKGCSYEKGHKILHFNEAFHGRSGYTMSLTNTDPNKVMYFPKFDWPRVTNPKISFPLSGAILESVIKLENQSIDEIKQQFTENKDEIAAIIIEPIQGEGGDNHFRNEFLNQLRILADENEALLIFDEVQTGVGLTGTMWAHEQMEVEPDIMAFGKKMQVCGILAGNKLDEIEDNVFHKKSRINSTWGGNLTDMARATKYLEIIEEENLVEKAAQSGEYLIKYLKKYRDEFPEYISNVRGRGLFCAFDIDNELRKRLLKNTYENGLLIIPSGRQSVRFRPPLNINEREIDEGMAILRKSLRTAI